MIKNLWDFVKGGLWIGSHCLMKEKKGFHQMSGTISGSPILSYRFGRNTPEKFVEDCLRISKDNPKYSNSVISGVLVAHITMFGITRFSSDPTGKVEKID